MKSSKHNFISINLLDLTLKILVLINSKYDLISANLFNLTAIYFFANNNVGLYHCNFIPI